MPSTEQEVKADAGSKGVRAPMEVVTFKDVSIGATNADRRVGWVYNRFMVDYIWNMCSRSPAKNIFWEEGKKSVLIYFVASKDKSQWGSFPSPSTSPPQTPGRCAFSLQ